MNTKGELDSKGHYQEGKRVRESTRQLTQTGKNPGRLGILRFDSFDLCSLCSFVAHSFRPRLARSGDRRRLLCLN
jgi:hypothetical protein